MLKYRKHVLTARIDKSAVTGKSKLRFIATQNGNIAAQGTLRHCMERARVRQAMQARDYDALRIVSK